MKIKAVVLDIWRSPVLSGRENGWSWFKDPARDIKLIQIAGTRCLSREEHDIEVDVEVLQPTLDTDLEKRFSIRPQETLFISNLDTPDRIAWAREAGFHTISVAPATGGNFSLKPPLTSDTVVRYVLLLEHTLPNE